MQPGTRPAANASREGVLLPREHGAWGMLIVPWLCSAVLAGRFDANVVAGLVAALSLFLLREPLIVLARQRWVWRVRKPESETARRCVVAELIVLAVSGAWLCWNTPCTPLFALAAMAVTQTAFAVAMAVRNRQRSLALQISGAITLPATALLPAHAAGALDRSWPWLLWLALAQHHVAAVLVVRSRLAILAGKVRRPPRLLSMTAFAVLLLAGVTALAVGTLRRALAVPPLFSAAVHLVELARLRRPANLEEPIRRVGFRALGNSILQAAMAAWAAAPLAAL